jgi:RNA polymerase sigma factor (sigma-70 family)
VGCDANMVREAQRGSTRAFSALMVHHQPAVRSFARRISADPGEADDLAQEAFIFAWSNLASLKNPERFRSWVLGVTWRKAQTRARTRARNRARDGAWLDTQSQTEGAVGEESATALQLFQILPANQRAVLALCHGEGWSQSEAADILGQPLGTVKSNMARAKARLRALIGGENE